MSAIPSTVDGVELLQELGLQVQEEKGDEIYARCPGHIKRVGHIDHDASWSLNVETGEHHCFSCGYGGTIWWLIAATYEWYDDNGDVDLKRAQKWLQRRGGDSMDVAKRLKSTARSFVRAKKRRDMDESRLALFVDPPDWALEKRGISVESARKYSVCWDTEYDCWVLPIRDPQSYKLWGWQLKGEGENRVFRNKPQGVKKSETLFGYREYKGKVAVVVESPLDVLRLDTIGITGVLSTYGATWTETQISLVCEKADSMIAAFDNPAVDPAGLKASMLLMGYDKNGRRIKEAKDWSRRLPLSFFNYQGLEKDPGELTQSQVFYGLSQSRSSVRGPRAVTG